LFVKPNIFISFPVIISTYMPHQEGFGIT